MTEPRTVGEHFDQWAPSYDAQIRQMVPRYEEIHDTLLALLALRPPSRILDLGAGTGYTLRRVLEAFPSATAVGLDVSGQMLGRARQRLDGLADRVELRASDIAQPEIVGSYDAPDPHEVEHDHPDTAAEHLVWMTAAGFAAVDVVWKYDDVGVLVAWRAER